MKRLFVLSLVAPLLFTGNRAVASYVDEILADNPVAYYQFDDTTLPFALDSSGNNNHGTFVGSPTRGVASAYPDQMGLAVTLDGVEDCIEVPALGTFSQLSIEMWVKWAAVAPPQSLYHDDGWDATKTHLVLDGWNQPLGRINAGTNNGNTWSSSPLDTEWRHVVAVLNAETDEVELYIDGVLDAATTHAGLVDRVLAGGNIGAWFNPWAQVHERFLGGVVDEVAFYGTALSAERIAAHHAAAVPEPSCLGLMAWGCLMIVLRLRRR